MGAKRHRRRPKGNRRVAGVERKRRRGVAVDPTERKTRNRIILALGVLGAVNAYVFLGTSTGLSTFGSLQSAHIRSGRGPLPPRANPPLAACGGDPVRIFEGLEDLISLTGTLHAGRTLRLVLLELGLVGAEIDRIEAAVRSKVDLGLLGGTGAPVRLAVDRSGGVHALEIELAEGHVLQACRQDEGFSVRNIQHPSRTDVEVMSFELGRDADLRTAVVEGGERPELADALAAVLAHEIDFLTESRPGDRLAVIVEKRWLGRHFHRYGRVLGVRLRGSVRRATLLRYKPEGRAEGFFDPEGQSVVRSLLRSPVAYFGVSHDARPLLVPSVEVVEGKVGAAYRLPEGAPLVALGDGVVRAASRTAEEGNFIDIELGDGTVVRYCNLMRFIRDWEPGEQVSQGQLLGLAGHTGRTPHDRLRLELWRREGDEMKVVDPLRLTAKGDDRPERRGEAVPAAQLARFRSDTEPAEKALQRAG